MRFWRQIIEISWTKIIEISWTKIIEISTQNHRDFNPKIIEILTLKSLRFWPQNLPKCSKIQPEIFEISNRNVCYLDETDICPPPRLQIKYTENFKWNMVTISNICVILFLFSLEKFSSRQKKKNESLTWFGNRHKESQNTQKISFYFLLICMCVCVGGEGLKKQRNNRKKIFE